MKNPQLKSFSLFFKALANTKHEMWVSVQVLVTLTLVLSIMLWAVESAVQPQFDLLGSLTWAFMRYIDDPAGFIDYQPVTLFGRIIAVMVGIIGIAVFAVPAGLIGSGFMDAVAQDKREKELETFRRRMRKAFRRASDRNLRLYLDTLPDGGGDKFKAINLVPSNEPIAKLQVRQGMDLKDIIDTCNSFPEFRLKNIADAYSSEEAPEDRIVVEHLPLNRRYGCCIQRDSKVTIICTTSAIEPGIGRFTYYLAKFGGFNYISKELTPDPDESDSFYNLSPEPLYDKKPLSHYTDKRRDKEAIETLLCKQAHRDEFLSDLSEAIRGENTWAIIIADHLQTSANSLCFHVSCALKDGSKPTINDQATYNQLGHTFAAMMKDDYGLDTDLQSSRFPLLKNNLCYAIRGTNPRTAMQPNPQCNAFVLRPSAKLINFDIHRIEIAFRIAQLFSQQLDNSRGIQPEDILDLKATGFGYKELPTNK